MFDEDVELPHLRQELAELLDAHFKPARTNDPAAKTKTTTELFSIIDEHAPGHFSATLLYRILKEKGYESHLVAGELVWSVMGPR